MDPILDTGSQYSLIEPYSMFQLAFGESGHPKLWGDYLDALEQLWYRGEEATPLVMEPFSVVRINPIGSEAFFGLRLDEVTLFVRRYHRKKMAALSPVSICTYWRCKESIVGADALARTLLTGKRLKIPKRR